MANSNDGRSENQPSKDAQVKGGQHSHQGKTNDSTSSKKETDGRSQNKPSRAASVKGGQSSKSGNSK